MSTANTERKSPSVFSQILLWLGVRPDEQAVSALLFSNMFMAGIATGMIRVCAYTLFLEAFGSDQLALVAILLMISPIVTVAIDRLTQSMSVAGYLFTVLGTVLAGLMTLRIALGVTDSTSLIFVLPLFFEIVSMLFSLQFAALLPRLLDVRQSKRLVGLTRSGEFLAEMVGGLSIALLLNYMGVLDLLLVAALATGLVFVIVQLTVRRFRAQLLRTNEEMSEEHDHGRMLAIVRIPYVKLITLCYAAYIFAYFFLDVAFYSYASAQFPEQRELAEFLGQFFAVVGLVTGIAMVLMFAPFLRRFGILGGVIAFPIVIATGSTAVSVLELTGAETATIFVVMVFTNAMRFVLQSAVWRPSVSILFQVLPDRQRNRGMPFIEGIVDPFSGGLAGLCLYIVSHYLGWEPKYFLLLLTVLMIGWIVSAFVIRRMYLSNLVVSIQKRKLGEMSLRELDNASLDIIRQNLDSPYPAEIFYCLNILEELEHPEITEMLKQVIANSNHEVRMDVLQRIARMEIGPLQKQVLQRIDDEVDPRVRGQALRTYAALGADDVVPKLTPFLDSDNVHLRRGALIGLLKVSPVNQVAQDRLLQMVRAEDPDERKFAAELMGEIASSGFSGFLVELLDDANIDVINAAVLAAGQIRDPRLISILVTKLGNPRLQGRAGQALQMFGTTALYDLDLGFSAPNATRQVKRQIIDIVREIGGVNAIEILLRHIDITQPELRHHVYLGLATLHYQADPDDQYVFVNKLEEEVQQITWLLATMDDLYRDKKYHQLSSALGQELDHHRDNMLLLISFLFPSIVMLDTRANIDSKVSELRVFALEVLDNLLTNDIKQVVIPILDDLSVAERLALLNARYPQESHSPANRFKLLVEEHFNDCFFWTRASLLYLIGKDQEMDHLEIVESAIDNQEPIIRETASWALAQLDPPDLRRSLMKRAADENEGVREIVAELLANLAKPT